MSDIAVVTVASWGDVLLSTVVTRAIKDQWPGRHITFITTSVCQGAVANNPDVDSQVVINCNTKNDAWTMQDRVIADARTRYKLVIAPWAGFRRRPDWVRADKPTKQNFMYAYARAAQDLGLVIPDPMLLYLYPTPAEQQRAATLLTNLINLTTTKLVMMEIKAESSQSHWNGGWTTAAITAVMDRYDRDVVIMISAGGQEPGEVTELAVKYGRHRIRYLNDYSLREMAVVYNNIHAFIGLSSGTGNVTQTHLCRRDVKRFEAINDGVYDSTPLGNLENKTFYYGADANEFARIVKDGLP